MNLAIPVLFENEAWCLVDKPCDILSVPSRIGDKDERPCLGPALQKQLGQRIWPVHRLDFEVSGLLLFAKNADAHRLANTWFEKGLVRKTYRARSLDRKTAPDPRLHPAHPMLREPEMGKWETWSAPLVRGKVRGFVAHHGKESTTLASWQPAPQGQRIWQLEPITGRSHQLRIHMALVGFPIIGDTLYGSASALSSGIALRAWRLDLVRVPEEELYGLADQHLAPMEKDWV